MSDFQFYSLSITFIFSIVTAGFTWAQWSINQSKLRLDLYHRRFDVYLKTLDYYLIFSNTKRGDNNYEDIDKGADAFIKAYRESVFLFGKESEVFKKLTVFNVKRIKFLEAHKKLNSQTASDSHRSLTKAEQKIYMEEQEELQQLLSDIYGGKVINDIEESLIEWLDFHEVTGNSNDWLNKIPCWISNKIKFIKKAKPIAL